MFQERLIHNYPVNENGSAFFSVIPRPENENLPNTVSVNGKKIEYFCYEKKHVGSFLSTMRKLYRQVNSAADNRPKGTQMPVLMYAVNPLAMIPLIWLRFFKKNLCLITICPELPEFRRYRKGIASMVKKTLYKFLNQKFDRYILFSKEMSRYIPQNKPFMVLEGFAPDTVCEYKSKEKNIAMYAGGLAFDNGIEMMIDAVHLSKYIDELWICGVGAGLDYITEHTDEKVKYLGRLSNSEVIEYESQAKVLLNVRNPGNELTAFSFPSKILEYMSAQGVVISSKLKGIPNEYDSHIVLLDEYSAEGLAKKMDEIFLMGSTELKQFTENNLSFMKGKTAFSRCEELKCFVEAANNCG